ncbi:MAG: uridine kinase [Candidatus Latescibacteria bacterium]|jgi:uridine kinase|nr:uridine kinase [Candidatus Latescibacterota bacterium]
MAGKPIVIGISGGSAAGKTTFTQMLSKALAEYEPVVLNQDRYFRDWSILPEDEREKERTANHPRAVVWEQLVAHVEALRSGGEIETPAPGTGRYARGEAVEKVRAGRLIVVEGHLVFGHEILRNLMDVKLFLEVDAHERVLRRMLRNTSSGMALEDAVAWYRRDVIPNFPIYTEATRQYADLIVPFEGETQTAVDVVTNGLRAMLEKP